MSNWAEAESDDHYVCSRFITTLRKMDICGSIDPIWITHKLEDIVAMIRNREHEPSL